MNFVLREIIRCFFFVMGKGLMIKSSLERKRLPREWELIKKEFLSPQVLPGSFEDQRERLHERARKTGEEIFVAKTSGTRSTPKTIPYTLTRLKETQKTFLASMIVLTSPVRGQKTFFVLSSLEEDSSLTYGLLKERPPTHMELLQAPYRYLTTPKGKELRDFIGLYASRLAIMIVTQPRFLYATNPSTLTHFLDELKTNWAPVQSNLKRLLTHQEFLRSLLRLAHGDALSRIQHVTKMTESPSLQDILPELRSVITWDGGYVTPFTERLKKLLPSHIQHLPMYSMSTETIESLPHRIHGQLVFLPSMKDTYPEFLKEGILHSPQEVRPGETYSLIVTNRFGLLRYDTQDEFLVVKMVDGIPDIRFQRRRNITASMTGEKISEEQCHILYSELRKKFPLEHLFLSLYGSARNGEFGYHLGLIGPQTDVNLDELGLVAQNLLATINEEYRGKVESGRLRPLAVQAFSVSDFAKLMGQEHQWESQFKVMPLYEKPLS